MKILEKEEEQIINSEVKKDKKSWIKILGIIFIALFIINILLNVFISYNHYTITKDISAFMANTLEKVLFQDINIYRLALDIQNNISLEGNIFSLMSIFENLLFMVAILILFIFVFKLLFKLILSTADNISHWALGIIFGFIFYTFINFIYVWYTYKVMYPYNGIIEMIKIIPLILSKQQVSLYAVNLTI